MKAGEVVKHTGCEGTGSFAMDGSPLAHSVSIVGTTLLAHQMRVP